MSTRRPTVSYQYESCACGLPATSSLPPAACHQQLATSYLPPAPYHQLPGAWRAATRERQWGGWCAGGWASWSLATQPVRQQMSWSTRGARHRTPTLEIMHNIWNSPEKSLYCLLDVCQHVCMWCQSVVRVSVPGCWSPAGQCSSGGERGGTLAGAPVRTV